MEPGVGEQVQAGDRNMGAVSMQRGFKVTDLHVGTERDSGWEKKEVWGPRPGACQHLRAGW